MKHVSRRAIGIAVPVAILLALYFGVRELALRRMPECRDVYESVFPSGDGVHDAVLAHQYCGGDTYWVDIRNNRAWLGGITEVFLTDDFAPNVVWSDPRHVVITINEVSHIRMSLHEADGVVVSYRLADRLSAKNYRQKIEQDERRAEELVREHQAKFSGDKSRDYYPQALAQQLEVTKKNYASFRQWAEANAENGD